MLSRELLPSTLSRFDFTYQVRTSLQPSAPSLHSFEYRRRRIVTSHPHPVVPWAKYRRCLFIPIIWMLPSLSLRHPCNSASLTHLSAHTHNHTSIYDLLYTISLSTGQVEPPTYYWWRCKSFTISVRRENRGSSYDPLPCRSPFAS